MHTTAVQGPLIRIGVQNIGQRGKFLPLHCITPFKFLGLSAKARRFQFHMTAKRATYFNPNIGSPAQVFDLRFCFCNDLTPHCLNQGLDWTFKLIFWLRWHVGREGFLQIVCKFFSSSSKQNGLRCSVEHR